MTAFSFSRRLFALWEITTFAVSPLSFAQNESLEMASGISDNEILEESEVSEAVDLSEGENPEDESTVTEKDATGSEPSTEESTPQDEFSPDEETPSDDTEKDEEEIPESSPDFSILILNEIDLEAEFLEIWNSGTEEIDLQDFQFSELSGGSEVRHDVSDFTNETVVAADGFLVLEMSRKLNNSGEIINLYSDAETTEPLQSVEIPSSVSGQSYSRQENGEFIWDDPTPGTQNFTSSLPQEPPSDEPPQDELPTDDEGEMSELPPDFSILLLNEINLTAEFLEIWNSGSEELDLQTFQFSELSGENEIRHNFSDFREDLTLPPGAFLVLEMTNKLNNSGETIKLYPSAEATESLQVAIVPSKESGQSYSRQLDETFAWTLPTPGLPNEAEAQPGGTENPPQNTDFQHIILNEIDPQAEFIELKNIGEESADVSTFQFSELSGENEIRRNFSDFSENLVISPNGFLVLELSGKLNNSGDTVSIYVSPEAETPLAEVIIPKSVAGQSYVRQEAGEFVWTTMPTPGAENIIVAPPSSGGGDSKKSSKEKNNGEFFKAPAEYPSLSREEVILQISEVSFNDPKQDTIELFCRECGDSTTPIDLQGFRLFDDETFFEFPPGTFVKTGEYVVIIMKTEGEYQEKTDFGWKFHITHKGLTRTDETLMLIDSDRKIEDAVCWGDHNGKFSSGEEGDVKQMKLQQEWQAEIPLDYQCFPSQTIGSKMSISRKDSLDTNTAFDFFPTAQNTFGKKNPFSPQTAKEASLQFESIVFLPSGKALIRIKNTGRDPFLLRGFHLKNIDTKLAEFPEKVLPVEAVTSIVVDAFPRRDIFLFLNDAWDSTEAFLCLNPVASFDESRSLLLKMKRAELWSSSRVSSCIFADIPEDDFFELARRNDSERNAAVDFTFDSLLENTPLDEPPDLFLSAIFPNPKGVDTDREWVEITSSRDIPDISEWMLLIGNRVFPLPTGPLKQTQSLRLTTENTSLPTLRNGDGSLLLFSPSGLASRVSWEKAKDNAILRFSKGEFVWDIPEKSPKTEDKKTSSEKRITPSIEKKKSRALQKDEISHVIIVSVLPNPVGSDSGHERIILKNISAKPGFLRNWKFATEKTEKEIPETFFNIGEEKTFFGKEVVPNLRNNSGKVLLLDFFGRKRDQIGWEKARDGELFGPGIIHTKTLRSAGKGAKKVTPKYEPVFILQEKDVSGTLVSFSEKSLTVMLSDGGERTYFFAEKNPQSFFLLSKVLKQGEEITLHLSEISTVLRFDVNQKHSFTNSQLIPNVIKTLDPGRWTFWMLLFFLLGTMILAYCQRSMIGSQLLVLFFPKNDR